MSRVIGLDYYDGRIRRLTPQKEAIIQEVIDLSPLLSLPQEIKMNIDDTIINIIIEVTENFYNNLEELFKDLEIPNGYINCVFFSVNYKGQQYDNSYIINKFSENGKYYVEIVLW